MSCGSRGAGDLRLAHHLSVCPVAVGGQVISDWLTTSLCALAVAVGGQVISDYHGTSHQLQGGTRSKYIILKSFDYNDISYSLVVWAI